MRLSHLTALAVMVALVGAMFVAMGSVSAEPVTKVTKDVVTDADADPAADGIESVHHHRQR